MDPLLPTNVPKVGLFLRLDMAGLGRSRIGEGEVLEAGSGCCHIAVGKRRGR